jgi:hypothetical protein
MKMHLVFAAALAGLCSHAAFARYDGGDTWSALEPNPVSGPTQRLMVAMTAPLSSLQRDNPSDYGSPAEADSVGRIVRLANGSHWVNVAYGESVQFIVKSQDGSDRSFAWRFNVAPNMSHVDLSDVAPADLPVHGVRVFVAADPRYTGE